MSPSNLTISQNKAQEYLKKYKNIQYLKKVKFTIPGIKSKITIQKKYNENEEENQNCQSKLTQKQQQVDRKQGQ